MSALELAPRHAISSDQYVENGITDLWRGLSLVEVEQIAEEGDDKSRIFDAEGRRIVIESTPLSFAERLRILFRRNATVPFHYTLVETVIVDDDGQPGEIIDEKERRAQRSWILDTSGVKSAQQPTPDEQGRQALRLITETERKHNPELIEAVKALPKATELLIKLPREISPQEKRRIANVVRNILLGKPITAKVTI